MALNILAHTVLNALLTAVDGALRACSHKHRVEPDAHSLRALS
jgi:hypothetical protein